MQTLKHLHYKWGNISGTEFPSSRRLQFELHPTVVWPQSTHGESIVAAETTDYAVQTDGEKKGTDSGDIMGYLGGGYKREIWDFSGLWIREGVAYELIEKRRFKIRNQERIRLKLGKGIVELNLNEIYFSFLLNI